MDSHHINLFIHKAIAKTKEKTLEWNTLSNTFEIKPIPEENSSINNAFKNIFSKRNNNFSYYSEYKSGQLLLLAYINPTTQPVTLNPPINCKLSLRIQNSQSPYAVEITNTDDLSNSQLLIRLYNLISKNDSSINALINDFLNS